jgi:hypothetical protein
MAKPNFIKAMKESATREIAVSVLSVLPLAFLQSLDLPGDLLEDISAKRLDDDYVGQAAVGMAFALSNNANTPTDRFVASQIMLLAAGTILRARPFMLNTLSSYDKDELTNLMQGLFNLVGPGSTTKYTLSGDALSEEVFSLYNNISQYNRDLVHDPKSQDDFSDVNRDEVGTVKGYIKDKMDKVGDILGVGTKKDEK